LLAEVLKLAPPAAVVAVPATANVPTVLAVEGRSAFHPDGNVAVLVVPIALKFSATVDPALMFTWEEA
jgi:hypothetical protein